MPVVNVKSIRQDRAFIAPGTIRVFNARANAQNTAIRGTRSESNIELRAQTTYVYKGLFRLLFLEGLFLQAISCYIYIYISIIIAGEKRKREGRGIVSTNSLWNCSGSCMSMRFYIARRNATCHACRCFPGNVWEHFISAESVSRQSLSTCIYSRFNAADTIASIGIFDNARKSILALRIGETSAWVVYDLRDIYTKFQHLRKLKF